MTRSNDTNGWRARMIGRDRTLVQTEAGATKAFALGPALGETDRFARLAAVAHALPGRIDTVAYCRQVHGDTVHRIGSQTETVVEIGDGDALLTITPGIGLLVWTADCVPVLLVGDGVVAAVHSGWRGCAADVVGRTVDEMHEAAGVTATDLHVAMGPSICGSCYEVGAEVSNALQRFRLDEARWLNCNLVDLRAFLASRLEALGVPAEQIETVGGCTVESPALASYRRDGAAAGRQWSMVFLNG